MAETAPVGDSGCGPVDMRVVFAEPWKAQAGSEERWMRAGDETGWSHDGYQKSACEQGQSGGQPFPEDDHPGPWQESVG